MLSVWYTPGTLNIHVHDGHVTGDHPAVRIKAGGAWSATQTAELEDGWYTLSFFLSWSISDIDSLQLEIDPQQVNNSEDVVVDAVYCEICASVGFATPTPTPTP